MKNRTVKNAAWIIGAKIVQAIANLLITMLTARVLGPANFGLVEYAMSVAAFAAPIMHLGITSILVQELVLHPAQEGELLGSGITACFASGLLSIVGILAFVSIANRNETETLIVCGLYSVTLLAQALEIITYWFQAHLLSKYPAVVSLMAYLVVSAYKAYILISHKSIYWFALSNAIDYLLISIFLMLCYHRLGGQKMRVSVQTIKRLMSKGKYYILSGLMIKIFSQTDRVMLKLIIGDEATGYYAAAVTCAGMTSFVVVAVIDSARPTIFQSKKDSAVLFEKNMIRLYSVIIYFGLLQSIGITLFSRIIVSIMYGPQYLQTVQALRIVVWYTTFSHLGAVRNIWLLAEGKQRLIWRIDVSGAAVNVLLNLILIPWIGVNGAAIASLITQIATNVFVVWLIKDVRLNIKLMRKSLNPRIIIELLKQLQYKALPRG